MSGFYPWLVAIHVSAMVAWMSGIFYLPRLFVYHADSVVGSDKAETFKVMERRLLNAIMRPAMTVTWVAGVALAIWSKAYQEPWLMVKFVLVLGMTFIHIWLTLRQKEFERDANTRPARTYRIINEVPALLLIAIVILAFVKPF